MSAPSFGLVCLGSIILHVTWAKILKKCKNTATSVQERSYTAMSAFLFIQHRLEIMNSPSSIYAIGGV